jgi:hypothetical protein
MDDHCFAKWQKGGAGLLRRLVHDLPQMRQLSIIYGPRRHHGRRATLRCREALQHATLKRVKPERGLWNELHWDALQHEKPVQVWRGKRYRRREPARRLDNHEKLPHHRHRDSVLRHRSQSGDFPSRGYNPSLPRDPCPGISRCRNSPVRKTPWARRRTVGSRNSRKNKRVESRC